MNQVKVQSNTTTLNIQALCREIDAGKAEQGGIKLRPFYQRDYKFTKKDESFLIESLLMGIPIPTIYLASDTSKFPHISNVIDGQHRLRAIHRFINNEYLLSGLEKMPDLNGLYFEDLPVELKNKLSVQTSLNVNYIHVQDDPSLELEIFLRYNRGTNPMSKQEIRHVLFGSPFNDWVTQQVERMKKEKSVLAEVFNMVKKRMADKAVHSDLFLMFNILHYGLNAKHAGTPYYVDEIMSKTRKMDHNEIQKFIEKSTFMFEQMSDFLFHLRSLGIKHTFSKELYAPSEKSHHFQASIMMIVTSVFKHILETHYNYKEDNELLKKIKKGFCSSIFYGAKSATTNFDLVSDAMNRIKTELEGQPVF
ncbi:DUF262 domain-containing protein [Zooshikella marina]|uniref:GmrSD restriction endonuclease domain-containing protein n=1 Tax=Zooshikella ganghwensis TaxID=202772 RepID=UPI001BAEA9B0|nr:DUF262 domain-containing protein [Zooshikella ganghwensis]MBU2708457.1 DUF262 domain-containing protein [Zooshikella ganghwensis]